MRKGFTKFVDVIPGGDAYLASLERGQRVRFTLKRIGHKLPGIRCCRFLRLDQSLCPKIGVVIVANDNQFGEIAGRAFELSVARVRRFAAPVLRAEALFSGRGPRRIRVWKGGVERGDSRQAVASAFDVGAESGWIT